MQDAVQEPARERVVGQFAGRGQHCPAAPGERDGGERQRVAVGPTRRVRSPAGGQHELIRRSRVEQCRRGEQHSRRELKVVHDPGHRPAMPRDDDQVVLPPRGDRRQCRVGGPEALQRDPCVVSEGDEFVVADLRAAPLPNRAWPGRFRRPAHMVC